jgi:hypothetical protein
MISEELVTGEIYIIRMTEYGIQMGGPSTPLLFMGTDKDNKRLFINVKTMKTIVVSTSFLAEAFIIMEKIT